MIGSLRHMFRYSFLREDSILITPPKSRYIRDRSLGGRMVKVDANAGARQRQWKSGSVWEDGEEGKKAFADSRPKPLVVKDVKMPEWWLSDIPVRCSRM